MAKSDTVYVCQTCGGVQPKWAGKCDACGDWNTLVEEAPSAPLGTQASAPKRRGRAARL
ncbi:DNA repair protein RadA, partial [Maricaulis sp. CAU 1757]